MRIGVIGRVEPDTFGANILEAVQDAGDVAVSLGPAGASRRLGPAWASRRLMITSRVAALSLQALPRLDERAQRRIVNASSSKISKCCSRPTLHPSRHAQRK